MVTFTNLPISISRKEIGDTFQYYSKSSGEHERDNPSDRYRVDRRSAEQYFSIAPKWKQKLLEYFSELKKAKEFIVCADICGRASYLTLGANKSYFFSYKTNELCRLGENKKNVFFDGDIFNPTHFSQFISVIRNDGAQLAFVTFMPMAGLQQYTPQTIEGLPNYEHLTYTYLSKRLRDIVRILRPGGYVMIERPFQFDGSIIDFACRLPQNQFKISIAMKKIARKLKCRIEILSGIGGPYFLLRKSV
jgi:hypothetical protein